jgi:hypothetical protein
MTLFYCRAVLDENEDHRLWDGLKVHGKDLAKQCAAPTTASGHAISAAASV